MSEDWQRARFIRASEVADYVYCQRQWWLVRVNGIRATKNIEALEQGTVHHEEHWKQVQQLGRNRRLMFVFFFAAITMLLLTLLLFFG